MMIIIIIMTIQHYQYYSLSLCLSRSSAVAERGDRLGTIDMGRKLGVCPFLGELGPPNTMSPGPRPTSVPSGILMHISIWPQYTWAETGGCVPFFGELCPHLT